MKSMLEPRQNPSCGTGTHTKQECVTWDNKPGSQGSLCDPVWFECWVLRQGEKVFAYRCYCPGIVFHLPARKINPMEFPALQGLHSHKHLKWQQTSREVKQLLGHRRGGEGRRDFYCTQGRNPFLVTDRSQWKSRGFPPEEAGQKVAQASPKRPKEQHILRMQIKIVSANKAQL